MKKQIILVMLIGIFLLSFTSATTPQITLNYPTSLINYGTNGSSLQLNFTVTATNLSNCWYNYNGTNITTYCSENNPLREYVSNSTQVTIGAGTNPAILKKNITVNEYVYNLTNEMQQASGGGNPITATISFRYSDGTQQNVTNSTTASSWASLSYQNPNQTKIVNNIELWLSNAFTGGNGDERNTNISAFNYSNTVLSNITLSSKKNVTIYANDTAGNLNTTTFSWDYQIFENSRTFNATSYETAYETYSINLTANSSLTNVYLNYNGTNYATTNSGGVWSYSRDLPTSSVGNNSVYWIMTYGGSNITSTTSYQNVLSTILAMCNATYTVPYLNITFKDETTLGVINATIPTSTFVYYLGSGSVNKTLTYTNTSLNYNYTLCVSPPNRSLYVDPYVQYTSTNYPQRIWNPSINTYNNTTTTQVLYLLSSTDGIYVTFQVINPSNQLISGVDINASRLIGGSEIIVGTGTTGSDGAVTFWLNPDFVHTFYFIKEGFTTYVTSFAPTQSAYTVTMGGGNTAQAEDYTRGVINSVYPSASANLYNDTIYNFNYTISSSYWSIDSFGFILRLPNGTILSTQSSSGTGTVSANINTSNYSNIIMNYYYVVSGNYTNYTTQWRIQNNGYSNWSILNLKNMLVSYINVGFFGLDNFGRDLIVFFILFISVGIMTYKYGATSQIGIMAIVFGIIFFFDVALGILPSPVTAIPHFPTFIVSIILAALVIKEVTQ